ncbi:MAG: hypothetical protein JRC86_00570 [Deltaproteobacteria bacterium]|nr:hypothetical protein [Deltaproteobacteria bacterium]
MRNARFWVYVHGWVKITLQPGDRMSWFQGGPTDEGWSSGGMDFHLWADGEIEFTQWSDGRDCDGRCSSEETLVARCNDLPDHNTWKAEICQHHHEPDYATFYRHPAFRPSTPEWKEQGYHQRDYSAEAAGY